MKKNMLRYITLILIGSVLLLAPLSTKADDNDTGEGVARVSLINGDVSTQRGDSGDWVAATLNTPVVLGDHVATGDDSRAEIELDYANIMRLNRNSEVKVADLTRSRIQLQLAQGTMTFTVLDGTQADVEIDTPNMAVRPNRPGSYRIQINSPEETEVIVRENGEADIATPQGSVTLQNSRRIVVEGTDNPEYKISDALASDGWDRWNQDRDKIISNARNDDKYVNRYYAGSQDLDRYGHWVNVPDYGWSWAPYASAGWVPYRYGRWVWEPYWGWTWVSYEPWGWAPYHYGRWYSYGSNWYWWPGYVTAGYYPVWGPAYVSFIGFGYGYNSYSFGFGYGYSSIGWLPLGPRDRCYPWWGGRRSYNRVNITNITNVTNINNVTNGRNRGGFTNIQRAYNDVHVRNGITTVSANDFANGRVPRSAGSVSQARLRDASLVQGALPVVPTRQSLASVDRAARVTSSARASAGRNTFFTRTAAPAARNQSFAQNANEIRQMMESPNSGRQATRANAAAGARGNVNTTAGNAARSNAAPNSAATRGSFTTNRAAAASDPAASRASAGASTEAARGNARAMEGNSSWRTFGASGPAKTSTSPQAQGRNNVAVAERTTPAAAAPRTQAPAARQESGRTNMQRFGAATSPRTSAAVQTPAASSQASREVKPEATPQTSRTSGSRETTNPGFRSFGSSGPASATPQSAAPRSVQPKAAPPSSNSSNRVAATQTSRTSGSRETTNPGFSRFESSSPSSVTPQRAPTRPAQQAAPKSNNSPAREATRSFSPRSAPASTGGASSNPQGFKKFTPQAGPRSSPSQSRVSPSRGEAPQAGWNRFPPASKSRAAPGNSRSESRSAPSRDSRPPLEIRKPIFTERAPRNFNQGSPNRGSYSRPSGGSFNRGSSRSTPSFRSSGGGRSAPSVRSSGGGRSAPARSSHSSSNHGRH